MGRERLSWGERQEAAVQGRRSSGAPRRCQRRPPVSTLSRRCQPHELGPAMTPLYRWAKTGSEAREHLLRVLSYGEADGTGQSGDPCRKLGPGAGQAVGRTGGRRQEAPAHPLPTAPEPVASSPGAWGGSPFLGGGPISFPASGGSGERQPAPSTGHIIKYAILTSTPTG